MYCIENVSKAFFSHLMTFSRAVNADSERSVSTYRMVWANEIATTSFFVYRYRIALNSDIDINQYRICFHFSFVSMVLNAIPTSISTVSIEIVSIWSFVHCYRIESIPIYIRRYRIDLVFRL